MVVPAAWAAKLRKIPGTIAFEVSVNSLMWNPYIGNVLRASHMPRGLTAAILSMRSVSGPLGRSAWDAAGLVATRAQGAFRPERSPRLVCLDPTSATLMRQRLPHQRQPLRHQMQRRRR